MLEIVGLSNSPPESPTRLAEECAHYYGFDEWLEDPEHEVWAVANEFFDDAKEVNN